MADNKKKSADRQHIETALLGALSNRRTFSDIWLIQSKRQEDDTYETILRQLTLIVNPLPQREGEENHRTSILINYTEGEGENERPRTFGHIFAETDEGIDGACQWIAEMTERAMSDLLQTTYSVHFAITEHIEDIPACSEFVNRVVGNMLKSPSSYDKQYNVPAYIVAILRVKGEKSSIPYEDYVRQLTLTEEIFAVIDDIK